MSFTPDQISKLAIVLQVTEDQLTKDLKSDPELAATLNRLLAVTI